MKEKGVTMVTWARALLVYMNGSVSGKDEPNPSL